MYLSSQQNEENDSFDPYQWIKTKLIGDKHLEDVDISYIIDYFNVDKQTALSQLNETIQTKKLQRKNEIKKTIKDRNELNF